MKKNHFEMSSKINKTLKKSLIMSKIRIYYYLFILYFATCYSNRNHLNARISFKYPPPIFHKLTLSDDILAAIVA